MLISTPVIPGKDGKEARLLSRGVFSIRFSTNEQEEKTVRTENRTVSHPPSPLPLRIGDMLHIFPDGTFRAYRRGGVRILLPPRPSMILRSTDHGAFTRTDARANAMNVIFWYYRSTTGVTLCAPERAVPGDDEEVYIFIITESIFRGMGPVTPEIH